MSAVRTELTDSAAAIGTALCESAFWHDGRCNWIGRSTSELPAPGIPLTPTVSALGPQLYAGTAGIALFLAELFARTNLPEAAATAEGAIRHALAHVDDIAPRVRRSFHSGLVGIAFAAAQVGLRTGNPRLVDDGLRVASYAVDAPEEDNLLDVISGNAGAIAPLLQLAALPGGEGLASAATVLADELASKASRRDDAWCWDNDLACGPGVGPTPLCGLAHGASGMGLALIELGVARGREDLVDGGLAAFRYEDRQFDAEHGNWPDLRELGGGADNHRTSFRPSFMVAWCHGAAGIGLARLRAYQLLPEHRDELLVGVERAARITGTSLQALPPESDVSPCHGRAGLAETLLYAAEVLEDSTDAEHVVGMWRKLLATRKERREWPCGVASGKNNPSLMLGYAGIGYSLLRADDPVATPSILMVIP